MMDVIVTAGGIPQPNESLYAFTQGESKAMLDIAGKPMIQWVLDALCSSDLIERVVIVGLPGSQPGGLSGSKQLTCKKPMTFLDNQGGMVANILYGGREILKANPKSRGILVASSDIPGITTEMVDWLVRIVEESNYDLYYNVITRQVMEKEFPGSRRTYQRLKDYELCGGDMNAISASMVREQNPIWDRLIESRKNPVKQAAILGFDTLLLLLLGRMTLIGAETLVSKRLGVRGKVVLCPYAPLGMDIDKPNQLELVRAYLSKKKA